MSREHLVATEGKLLQTVWVEKKSTLDFQLGNFALQSRIRQQVLKKYSFKKMIKDHHLSHTWEKVVSSETKGTILEVVVLYILVNTDLFVFCG